MFQRLIQRTVWSLCWTVLLSSCTTRVPIHKDCADDEIWDGKACVDVSHVTNCEDLPKEKRKFCEITTAKRFAFFRRHDRRYEAADRQQITRHVIREIERTAEVAQNLPSGIKYLCATVGNYLTCTELSSFSAAYDNEVSDRLFDDIRAMQTGEVAHADVFLNCGDGVLGLANLGDLDPNLPTGNDTTPPDPETVGNQANIGFKFWKTEFSEETGDKLIDHCAQLRESAANGNAIAAGLGLSPVGVSQCDAFTIDEPQQVRSLADAVIASIGNPANNCSTILPFDAVRYEDVRYRDADGNEISPDADPPTGPDTTYPEANELTLSEIWAAIVEFFGGKGKSCEDTPDGRVCGEKIVIEDEDDDVKTEALFGDNDTIYISKWTGCGPDCWESTGGWKVVPWGSVPKDCIDPVECEACLQMVNSYVPDAIECVRGETDSPLCENIATASQCCASGSDFYTDPRIVLPNPEGEYSCYAAFTPGEHQRRYCENICSVAEHQDCVGTCMVKERPALDADFMANACQYMISDACFQQVLPEEMQGGIGGSGSQPPPTPVSLDERTLIPNLIPQDTSETRINN